LLLERRASFACRARPFWLNNQTGKKIFPKAQNNISLHWKCLIEWQFTAEGALTMPETHQSCYAAAAAAGVIFAN
jgi:hypothetical protein